MTADSDRDVALERMADEYGGHVIRVLKMKVRVPSVPQDPEATLTLPVDGGEMIQVDVTD